LTKRAVAAVFLLSVLLLVVSQPVSAQNQDKIDWEPPLAGGGAPSCPEHVGSRTHRSETIGQGKLSAVILGHSERVQNNKCTFDAKVKVTGIANLTLELPSPGEQSFSIVDFSEDGRNLLLASEHHVAYPNEQFRDVAVAVFEFSDGRPTWINVWDVFGWGNCDAMVEPQGFASDGLVVLRVRPSVMVPSRRPNCVPETGLYETNLAAKPIRLPDNTKIKRYGKLVAEAAAPCKTDPDIVAACFSVHGRLSAYNGNPTMRIWRVGTKRILGVEDGPMPLVLQEKMSWDVEAWGNFEVCPFTRERSGAMQMVCIESVDDVLFKDEK
jgi:hypothetical protein